MLFRSVNLVLARADNGGTGEFGLARADSGETGEFGFSQS